MNVKLYSKKGKTSEKKVKLDESVFGVKVNETLMAMAVDVYLSNQRQANAHTKDRGDVRGGGKKPWRQKGTGRARHGSTRSPIWTGGGVTFGPTNERNYKKTMTKKMRVGAIRSAFTYKVENDELFVMETFTPSKTKEIVDLLKAMKLDNEKVTFVQIKEEGLYKSARNISSVNVTLLGEINTYDILNSGKLVLLEDSLGEISKRWGSEDSKVSTKKVAEEDEKKDTKKKTTTKKETLKKESK